MCAWQEEWEDRGGEEREVFEIYGEGDMQMEQILLCSDASHARNEGILLKLAQRAHSATRKGRAGIEEGNFKDKYMFDPLKFLPKASS